MLALSQLCEGEGGKSAKSTGPCAKESEIMDFSLGKKTNKNPADFRNRGSLGKDSPGQLPSPVNPRISPAPLPQIKYLELYSEVMYEPKKQQRRSRTSVLTDIHLCMKPQVPHKISAYSHKGLPGETRQTSGRISFYQLKFF